MRTKLWLVLCCSFTFSVYAQMEGYVPQPIKDANDGIIWDVPMGDVTAREALAKLKELGGCEIEVSAELLDKTVTNYNIQGSTIWGAVTLAKLLGVKAYAVGNKVVVASAEPPGVNRTPPPPATAGSAGGAAAAAKPSINWTEIGFEEAKALRKPIFLLVYDRSLGDKNNYMKYFEQEIFDHFDIQEKANNELTCIKITSENKHWPPQLLFGSVKAACLSLVALDGFPVAQFGLRTKNPPRPSTQMVLQAIAATEARNKPIVEKLEREERMKQGKQMANRPDEQGNEKPESRQKLGTIPGINDKPAEDAPQVADGKKTKQEENKNKEGSGIPGIDNASVPKQKQKKDLEDIGDE